MIFSSRFTALLDANVLYGLFLRSYLMYLAKAGIYKPKWTDEIHEEWIRNLLKNRKNLKREKLLRTRDLMDKSIPDAKVYGYEDIVKALELPDPNDRHVLAAAIRSNASVIVTFNLKHFPLKILNEYDLFAQHPDEFLFDILDLAPEQSLIAFRSTMADFRKPILLPSEALDVLRKAGLPKTAKELGNLIDSGNALKN